MTDDEVTTVAGLIPPKINLNNERDLLDYITLLICPVLNVRASDAESRLEDIRSRALALRLARAM